MRWFWLLASAAFAFRLFLVPFADNLNLGSRPEVVTPVTSLRRLAEGYWLKQSSLSPYAGSMYHGSPLLLIMLGPLTVKRNDGKPTHIVCRFVHRLAYTCNWSETRADKQEKLEVAQTF